MMNKTLIACRFCGKNPDETLPNKEMTVCENKNCPIQGVHMTRKAWNKQKLENKTMIIVDKDTRDKDVWFCGYYVDAEKNESRYFTAKVYDTPSEFGVNECRVSKLTIEKPNMHGKYGTMDYFNLIDYNYDRGLDFDNLPDAKILKEILEFCNKLDTPWLLKEQMLSNTNGQ